jgi:phosphatidyl-myo-inositol dimannoside synthase
VSGKSSSGKRILALVTDAYGGYGGIAAYNRDVIDALALDERVAEIRVVPRSIVAEVTGVPPKTSVVEAAAGGAVAYIRTAMLSALRGGRWDLIYCGHINLAPLAALVSRLSGAPWALCIYGVEAWKPSSRRSTNLYGGRADHVVSLSQLTLDRYRAIWPVPAERCTVIPNAVHLEQFAVGPKRPDLEARYGLEGKKVLMTFGRLDPTEQAKGFDRMIKLMPRFVAADPDIRYLICGKGGDRPHLEDLAAEHGVSDKVVFAGMVPEEDKADHYRLADVYAMPSHGEGFGFVFLEAMACGIPCVASDIDGGREALRLGELGWVVDPHQPDQIFDAVMAALARPKGVPAGLDYFSFANFRRRVLDALLPVMR